MKSIVLASVVLGGIGVLALLVYWWTTDQGIGISPDSASYIECARNFANGRGLAHWNVWVNPPKMGPFIHWPPLYPIMLAPFEAGGVDPAVGARWLGAAFFVTNVVLIGALLFICTGGAIWIAAAGSVLALCSRAFIETHVMAWSEPPFFFFAIVGLALIAAHLERRSYVFLLGAAIVIGLSWVTRYVGVSLPGAGALGLLLWGRRERYARWRDAAILGVVGSIPSALWMWRNHVLTGHTSDREILFSPVPFEKIRSAFLTFTSWILPGNFLHPPWWLSLLVTGILVPLGVAVFLWRRSRRGRSEQPLSNDGAAKRHLATLPRLFALFGVAYFAMLLVSISLIDRQAPLDNRMLSPVFFCALFALLCLAHEACARRRGRSRLVVTLVVGAVLVGMTVIGSRNARTCIAGMKAIDRGMSGPGWRENKALAAARQLPMSTLILTNGPEYVHFLTGRANVMFLWNTGRARPEIEANPAAKFALRMSELKEYLAKPDTVLLYLGGLSGRTYLPTEKQLLESLPLRMVADPGGGRIYELDKSRAMPAQGPTAKDGDSK